MELSFAQALNDAKQVIVQQAARIKADSDKIRIQQELLSGQGATISDQEKQISTQAREIERQAVQIDVLSGRLNETITAKEQTEAVVNRQGERIQSLQATLADAEKKVSEQSEQIHDYQRQNESLMEKLPTRDDIEALASMSALLTKKVSSASSISQPSPQLRLAEAA